MGNKQYRFETLQLHVGQEQPDSATDARAVPIYQTTSYVFRDCAQAAGRFSLSEGGNIYGRLTNPTQGVLEDRVAALEGGAVGLAVASGAAAITYAIQALAKAGDHIVAQNTIYGGTYNLLDTTLRDYGISTTFVNVHDLSAVERAIRPETKAVYLETLGNPNSDIPDIEKIAKIAHAHQIPLVIDNTFGTPYLIRPLSYGADVVVHSATKFIGGHGTSLGGIIVDGGTFDWAASGKFPHLSQPNPSYHGVSFTEAAGAAAFVTYIRAILLRDTGAAISPLNAFILLQGLETLSLRLDRHVENALKAVDFLENHPKVEKVNHPSLKEHPDHVLYTKYFPKGAASIFTFEIKGTDKEAQEFIDSLELFSLLANVADVKSLVIHPATTTHAQMSPQAQLDAGIKPNTIRLSIGTEHIDDILEDLSQAFDKVFGKEKSS
ncbi:MAG: O-acetylhomoserine aminocarboxypropyltransferase/cysteine synthase [Eubacteriales bacterium]|nr:O-acetylhomoserine aminocarboxypropyltransferase/cysteine synthase [Eubacteriales bacterium]